MDDNISSGLKERMILEYWLNNLSEEIPETMLPVFNMVETEESKTSAKSVLEQKIPESLYFSMSKVCKNSDVGIFVFLLSILYVVLRRYSGNECIVLGTSGFIIEENYEKNNIVLLKNNIAGHMKIKELLINTKKVVLDAVKYQGCRIEKIFEKLESRTSRDYRDLFRIAFVCDKINENCEYLNDFGLVIYFSKENGNSLKFVYDSNIYHGYIIGNFAAHIMNCLGNALEGLDGVVDSTDILSKEERYNLIYGMNETHTDFPKEKVFVQLFEEEVEKTPNNIAVEFENSRLSYKELNSRVNQLAWFLRENGISRNSMTAIFCKRSIEMMVGIIGIFKAGGAYIPLDIDNPADRIITILSESKVKIILTVKESIKTIEPYIYDIKKSSCVEDIICLDEADEDDTHGIDGITYINTIKQYPVENPTLINHPTDLAYVIYTSGSTGKPKGVMVEHVGMLNHLFAKVKETNITENDIIAQNASQCFDISVWQFLVALLVGAKTHIISNEIVLNPHLFIKELVDTRISILEVVPSYLYLVLDLLEAAEEGLSGFEYLKILFVTGEALKYNLVNRWFMLYPGIRMVNAYGPTEASDDITHYSMDKAPKYHKIPIGKPLQNFNIYIINKKFDLCPLGIVGEICVSGIGVGKGYVNLPQKTMEVFMLDPFKADKEIKLYKTGDIGRYLPDGNIEFLGRKDYQVKIRGYRIELEEIETQLILQDNINDTVVIDIEDSEGAKHLCAYYTSRSNCDTKELKNNLLKTLPDYMIPSYFIKLDKMPLTPNGKINRRELPRPDVISSMISKYVAPKSSLEKELARIWSDVLGIEKIGVNDDFFELGGYSLKAIMIISRILKDLCIEITLKDMFRIPTIRALAEYIKDLDKVRYSDIPGVLESDYYEASSAQKRMYILNKFEGINTAYNLPTVVLLEGHFDEMVFGRAVNELVKRHEAFRTYFEFVDGKLVQRIIPHLCVDILYQAAEGNEIEDIISNFIIPFDLQKAPLLRIGLVKKGINHILMIDMHHIIADAFSSNIIINELIKLYNREELPSLRIQYKDFASWQNSYLRRADSKKQENYWLGVYKDEISDVNLPLDYKRPLIMKYEGDRIEASFNKDITDRIINLAVGKGVTMNILLLTAFNVLLSKYSGQEDIVVGLPVSGRRHPDLESIVGIFVNTLAIRTYPKSHMTFSDFMGEVKEKVLNAYENQDYPFEELVEKLNVKRVLNRNPLFDTMFVMQAQQKENDNSGIKNLKIKPCEIKSKFTKFDITLSAIEDNGEIKIFFEYHKSLFKKKTIESISNSFLKIIRQIIDYPEKKLSDIEVLSDEECRRILYEFNSTAEKYPTDKTIHELFQQQVEKSPNSTALIYEDKEITYSELNSRANGLARVLKEKGLVTGSIVGILVEHSPAMVISILGVLKAGGVYLPMEPKYPSNRIQYMLEHSNAWGVLTQRRYVDKLANYKNIIILDNMDLNCGDCTNLPVASTMRDLAYVIYTSGSTGSPKGVMIEHRNLVNYVCWARRIYVKDTNEVFAFYSSIAFDLTVTSVFVPLICGAKVAIYKDNRDEYVLYKILRENKVDIIKLTPSHMTLLREMDNTKSKLKRFIVGGEDLKVDLASDIHKSFGGCIEIYNEYGPTESTVGCMIHKYSFDSDNDVSVPIGIPSHNTQIYILDKDLHPIPDGAIGEMYVSGAGVGRGYLNRPNMTEDLFINNPFLAGEKMYRTGDTARHLKRGVIEYCGRIDNQIKIRGFRVELGEIESIIKKFKGVKNAVVIDRDRGTGKYLCAYIVDEGNIKLEELKNYLYNSLPDYMVPSYFMSIVQIPLTINGKIDKNALPESDIKIPLNMDKDTTFNEVEKCLRKIWSNILGMEEGFIGVDHNFFDIGGNSILIINLHNEVTKIFPELVTVTDLFSYPTVRKLSKYIMEKEGWINKNADYVPKYLEMPDEYFIMSSKDFESAVFDFRVGNEFYDRLKVIADNEQIKLNDIILSIYIYVLYKAANCDTIPIQAVIDKHNHIGWYGFNLENIKDISGLFKLVSKRNNSDIRFFGCDIQDINTNVLDKNREKYSVLPLLVDKSLLAHESGLIEMFDIVLEFIQENKAIKFRLEYNKTRLCQDKIKDLIDTYIEVLEYLMDHSA